MQRSRCQKGKVLPDGVIFTLGTGFKTTGKLKKWEASVTVEAACVFPLFIFAVLAFYYMFIILGIQAGVYSALADTASEASLSGYYQSEDFLWEAAFLTNLDARIRKNPCIVLHLISLQDSCYNGDDFYVTAKYRLKLPVPLLTLKTITVKDTICGRKYVGLDQRYEKEGAGENNADTDKVYVYITKTGSVYHRSADCSHIRLSIHTITLEQVEDNRNGSGGKYYPCERCRAKKAVTGQSVYIAKEGDRFHINRECSGLKRMVQKVLITEVGDRRPCSKCGH